MKCVNCSKQTFIELPTELKDINMKVCTNCGAVVYFYRKDKLDIEVEIKSLSTQIEALEIIAANDNQTVKNQKEAEKKIETLEAKIEALKAELKELDK